MRTETHSPKTEPQSFKAEPQPLKSEQARILQTGAKFLQKEAPPVYTGAEAMQIVRFLRTDQAVLSAALSLRSHQSGLRCARTAVTAY